MDDGDVSDDVAGSDNDDAVERTVVVAMIVNVVMLLIMILA